MLRHTHSLPYTPTALLPFPQVQSLCAVGYHHGQVGFTLGNNRALVIQSQEISFSTVRKRFSCAFGVIAWFLQNWILSSLPLLLLNKPNRYSWRTSEWKECQVALLLEQQDPLWHDTGPVCGGGIQTREVYCAQSLPSTVSSRAKEGRQPAPGRGCDWLEGDPTPVPLLVFFLTWK